MVLLLLPRKPPQPTVVTHAIPAPATARARRTIVLCLGTFFTVRWFITSAIAVNILMLLQGIGLTLGQSIFVAALFGPGQSSAVCLNGPLARAWASCCAPGSARCCFHSAHSSCWQAVPSRR